MKFFIICTIGNSIFNILMALFHYKTCFKFEDLGKITTSFSTRGKIGRRKKAYLVDIIIDNKPLLMAIPEDDYENLDSHETIEVYARKFPSKFNSYITEYSLSLHKTDWIKKECTVMWQQFLFAFSVLEIMIVCIAFQL